MRRPPKGLTLVKVKALVAFTETTKFGQFHGDPNGLTEEAKNPSVPDFVVDRLVARGWVSADPLDHDGDGAKGGSRKGAASTAAKGKAKKGDGAKGGDAFTAGAFAIAAAGGIGMYEITGPGLDAPEKVKGKAKAQARLDALNAAQPPASDPPPND